MTVGKLYPHKPASLIIISQNKHSCCWSYQGGMLSMCEVSEYWVVSPETKSSRSYDRLTTKCGNCTESACTEVTYCTESTCTQRLLFARSLVVHRGYLLTTLHCGYLLLWDYSTEGNLSTSTTNYFTVRWTELCDGSASHISAGCRMFRKSST